MHFTEKILRRSLLEHKHLPLQDQPKVIKMINKLFKEHYPKVSISLQKFRFLVHQSIFDLSNELKLKLTVVPQSYMNQMIQFSNLKQSINLSTPTQ